MVIFGAIFVTLGTHFNYFLRSITFGPHDRDKKFAGPLAAQGRVRSRVVFLVSLFLVPLLYFLISSSLFLVFLINFPYFLPFRLLLFGIPCFLFRIPNLSSSRQAFRAVWPPIVGNIASGFSTFIVGTEIYPCVAVSDA